MSFELDALVTKDVETLDIEREADLTRIITILKKRARSREKEELVVLYSIIRQISFFDQFWKEFPLDIHLLLLRELQYQYIPKGGEVFKAGDDAKNFYIILKGSVFILAPHKDNRSTVQEFEDRLENSTPRNSMIRKLPTKIRDSPIEFLGRQLQKNPFAMRAGLVLDEKKSAMSRAVSPSEMSIVHHDEEIMMESGPILTDVEIMELYPNHALLNTLKQEDHFGEIALTNNVARTATVVSRENCHFLYLSNSAYRKTLKLYKDQFETEAMDFLKSNPLTGNWPIEHLAGLMRQSKGVIYGRSHEIYKPGDITDAIFFVREGEVELSRQIEVEVDPFDIEYNMKKEQQAMKGDLNNANSLISMNTLWKKKYHKLQTRTIKCALLGRGEMFGDEELVKKEDRRKFRAVVKSITTSLIIIPLVKLLENAPDPDKFLDSIAHHNIKQIWRSTLTRGIFNEIKDMEDHKRQELKEIKEIKEHLEQHIPKSIIPVENIKHDQKRIKSIKTASLGMVSVPFSPKTDRNTRSNREYLYQPLPGKSKGLLKVIDDKQKGMKKFPISNQDPIFHKPKQHKPYLGFFNKEPIIQELKNGIAQPSEQTNVFEGDLNFKDSLRTNNNVDLSPRVTSKMDANKESPSKLLKKKTGEFTKLNLMNPEDYPMRFLYAQEGNDSPSQKIRNSIRKATKLWEKEYKAFIISPKRYNSQENISPNGQIDFTSAMTANLGNNPSSNTGSQKMLRIEDLSKIQGARTQVNTPQTTQKRKAGLSQDEKSKLQLYKSLKLEKIFATGPAVSLEDYLNTVRNEISNQAARHSRKHSALNALISPKSHVVSNSLTHREMKKNGHSHSSSQISFDPMVSYSIPYSSFRAGMMPNKKL